MKLDAAVSAVRAKNWSKNLPKAQAAADVRALADGFTISRSDIWTYDAPRVAVAGTDSRTFTAPVGLAATHLKVAISHPSGAVLGLNGPFSYTVTVRDATGRVLGTTTESITAGAGTATVLINLRSAGAAYGTFSFDVSGELAVSDPDTIDSASLLGQMVTLQVAQLTAS